MSNNDEIENDGDFVPNFFADQFALPTIEGYKPDLQLIAEGGQARVYRAISDQGQERAVKVYSYVEDPEHRAIQKIRFLTEVNLLRQINHRGIVRYIDHSPVVNGDETQRFHLIMDFVEGLTLQAHLNLPRSPQSLGQSWEPEIAAKFTLSLCLAVKELHDRNFAHRDIKPSNIIVRTDSLEPVLIDFGIVHSFDQTIHDQTQLAPHTIGRSNPDVGSLEDYYRHDLYAIGLVLAESLSGLHIDRIKSDFEINYNSRNLLQVIRRSLELDGAKRYENIQEMIADLTLYLSHGDDPEPISKWFAWSAAILVTILLITMFLSWNLESQKADPSVRNREVLVSPPLFSIQAASALRGCKLAPVPSFPGFAVKIIELNDRRVNLSEQALKIGDILFGLGNKPFQSEEDFFKRLLETSPPNSTQVYLVKRARKTLSFPLKTKKILKIQGSPGVELGWSDNHLQVVNFVVRKGTGNKVLGNTEHILSIDGKQQDLAAARRGLRRKRINESTIFKVRMASGIFYKFMVHASNTRIETAEIEIGKVLEKKRGIVVPQFRLKTGKRIESHPMSNYVMVVKEFINERDYYIAAPLPKGGLILQRIANHTGRKVGSAYRIDDNPKRKHDKNWRFIFEQKLGQKLAGVSSRTFYNALRDKGYDLVDVFTKHFTFQMVDQNRVQVIELEATSREEFLEKSRTILKTVDPSFCPISLVWRQRRP